MPETIDQQCRFALSLQHQTEYPYRYSREYESMFSIVFYHCWNKSGLVSSLLVLLGWGSIIPGFCLSTAVQNYLVSFELKLALSLAI